MIMTGVVASLQELRLLVEHALQREFPQLEGTFEARTLAMVDLVAQNFASLMAEWLRVGFCQVCAYVARGSPHMHSPLL